MNKPKTMPLYNHIQWFNKPFLMKWACVAFFSLMKTFLLVRMLLEVYVQHFSVLKLKNGNNPFESNLFCRRFERGTLFFSWSHFKHPVQNTLYKIFGVQRCYIFIVLVISGIPKFNNYEESCNLGKNGPKTGENE